MRLRPADCERVCCEGQSAVSEVSGACIKRGERGTHEEEGDDVGIVLEALGDALLLALAVGALEADVLEAVARERLHEEVEGVGPGREDDDLGLRVGAAGGGEEGVSGGLEAKHRRKRSATHRRRCLTVLVMKSALLLSGAAVWISAILSIVSSSSSDRLGGASSNATSCETPCEST